MDIYNDFDFIQDENTIEKMNEEFNKLSNKQDLWYEKERKNVIDELDKKIVTIIWQIFDTMFGKKHINELNLILRLKKCNTLIKDDYVGHNYSCDSLREYRLLTKKLIKLQLQVLNELQNLNMYESLQDLGVIVRENFAFSIMQNLIIDE